MNIAVINLKDTWKYAIKIICAIFIIFVLTRLLTKSGQSIKKTFISRTSTDFFISCIQSEISIFNNKSESELKVAKATSLMGMELGIFNPKLIISDDLTSKEEQEKLDEIKQTVSSTIEISKQAKTESISDRNFIASYTNSYNNTKIDNQSNYTLTEEMLSPDAEIINKKDVFIYHTHTCESYTPCDTYNYTMTGNYRTTDSNYNVVRVGNELKTCLNEKGFNVTHDETYHDYPSYSGSYARSLETAENMLYGKTTDIVIDLHRDAVGNGDTYGPTIMVNDERVAQLMFVIGTDGGGLEHPNWIENLKIAIKIQEKANEMYPGLFRPIIIRNSRYNQHVAKAASIIEVGATANTLGECLLSMQCLANVLEEVCK